MVKISDSKLFFLQAFIIWAIVCLPGNIFTTVLLYLQYISPPASANGSDVDLSSNKTFDYSTNIFNMTPEGESDQSTPAPTTKNLPARVEESLENNTLKKSKSLDIGETLDLDLERVAFGNKHCYELVSDYGPMRSDFRFWVEGVAITVVGVIGLAGNFLAVLVLKDSPSSKSFDRLLISLAIWDSLLILDMLIQKAIVGNFLKEEPHWFKISYPYFWHPIKGMVKNGTIFMVVAVSAERYRAICNPLSKRQPPINFILLVICMSITLDLPRFFHFELVDDQTEYWTSKLMENPVYIRFSSYWDGLIATGIIPLIALIIFNLNIYLKIRASSKIKYKFVGGVHHRGSRQICQKNGRLETTLNIDSMTADYQNPDETRIETFQLSMVQIDEGISPVNIARLNPYPRLSVPNFKPMRTKLIPVNKECETRFDNDNPDCINIADSNNPNSDPHLQPDETGSEKQRNAFRRRREKSTLILVGIVVLFLACHSYRLALKVFELAHPSDVTMDHFNLCYYMGRHHVPVVIYVLQNLNYLFLVFNSSINFIIYCCAGREFRTRTARLFRRPSK